MKKPELLVTPQSVEHVKALLEAGADAFVIGEQKFGLRLAGDFTVTLKMKGLKIDGTIMLDAECEVLRERHGLWRKGVLCCQSSDIRRDGPCS